VAQQCRLWRNSAACGATVPPFDYDPLTKYTTYGEQRQENRRLLPLLDNSPLAQGCGAKLQTRIVKATAHPVILSQSAAEAKNLVLRLRELLLAKNEILRSLRSLRMTCIPSEQLWLSSYSSRIVLAIKGDTWSPDQLKD
jgi:hypothetical protein